MPVCADFKKFGKSKLAALNQTDNPLTEAAALVALYTTQQVLLYPALSVGAQKFPGP